MFSRPAVHPEKRVMDSFGGSGKRVLPKMVEDQVILRYMGELSYSSSDNAGSGSALSSLTASAASIGTAAIASQLNPSQLSSPPPTTTRPAAPVATTASSTPLVLGVLLVGALVLFFALK
jgi:hypothetical protein